MLQSNNTTNSPHQSAWLDLARATARKVNLGWWIQRFNTPVVILALVLAAAILIARYYGSLPSYWSSAGIICLSLLSISTIAYFRTKKHFESPQESLVRVEQEHGLGNALSAAHAGVSQWPEIRPTATSPHATAPRLRWHLPRLLIPSTLALLTMVLAFIIPIGSYASKTLENPSPTALTQLENQLEQLADEEIVQEDYIEEMEQKLEDFKQEDPADMFSHSNLEAIDALQQQHQAASQDMKQQLNQAERALQNLQKHGDKLQQADKEALLNDFSKAVENLDSGNMKPNKELLDQLKQIDPNQLNQLNQEQLDQLRQNMRQMAEKLRQQNADGNKQGNGQQNGEDQNKANGNEGGQGEGDAGENDQNKDDGNGAGGRNRGPSQGGTLLGEKSETLKLGNAEKIAPKSLEETLPGDLLETTDGEHEIDKTDAKVRSGGSSSHQGSGGERVWKNSLSPDEKKALKKFHD